MVTPGDGDDRRSYSQDRGVLPNLKDGELELIRKRQHDRARVTALLLGAFVVLMFLIMIAKTGINW